MSIGFPRPALMVVAAALTHVALAQDAPARVLGLMRALVVPASNAVFVADRTPPRSEREWIAVEIGAARLIDAGKTLEAEAPATGGEKWAQLSRAMADAAKGAGAAARARNLDGVLDAGDVLFATCEDCHRQFVKK